MSQAEKDFYEALVAYLQSLINVYEYPEARPVVPAAAKEGVHK